jgi:predicted  nucleic acid-binding Zn-ribbon protein
LNGHKIYDSTTTNIGALLECCSKDERLPMIELRQLIDDIRQAERELSTVANKRQVAASEVEKTSKAVEDQRLELERISMTERALSEAGSRYSSKAQRAMRRGLGVDDVDEILAPLTKRAMIPAATNLVIVAKDQGGAAMLELQRVESVAKETLASLETEFAEAEDALESLRDDLRILQSQPTA